MKVYELMSVLDRCKAGTELIDLVDEMIRQQEQKIKTLRSSQRETVPEPGKEEVRP